MDFYTELLLIYKDLKTVDLKKNCIRFMLDTLTKAFEADEIPVGTYLNLTFATHYENAGL